MVPSVMHDRLGLCANEPVARQPTDVVTAMFNWRNAWIIPVSLAAWYIIIRTIYWVIERIA